MTPHHTSSAAGARLPWKGRPGPHTKTGKVWEVADALFRQDGRIPSRQEVLRRCAAEGGDEGTASTQFYLWRQSKAALDAAERIGREAPKPRGERLGTWVPVAEDGTLTLPPEVVGRMRLDPSREVLVQVVDGEVRLRSKPVALEHARHLIRSFDTGRGSMVDELIAERRAEAAREAEE